MRGILQNSLERRCCAYADLAFFGVPTTLRPLISSWTCTDSLNVAEATAQLKNAKVLEFTGENTNLDEIPLWRRRDRNNDNSKSRRRSHTAFRQTLRIAQAICVPGISRKGTGVITPGGLLSCAFSTQT